MTSSSTPQTVLDGLSFGEGPRWHDGRLWFSDFHTHRVQAMDEDGKAETIVEVPKRPSGLGWLPDGRLLVVSMQDRRLMRLDPGGLVEHADLSGVATFDCNDMVVDGHGRAYVGNFGFDFAHGEATEARRARARHSRRLGVDSGRRPDVSERHRDHAGRIHPHRG